eukprot:996397-Pyramimonas_sp.AAC.1
MSLAPAGEPNSVFSSAARAPPPFRRAQRSTRHRKSCRHAPQARCNFSLASRSTGPTSQEIFIWDQ